MTPEADSQQRSADTIFAQLSAVLEERRQADAEQSYVASLYARGLNKILEKVGEEATEVILAARDLAETSSSEGPAKTTAEEALVGEVADLWFHTMVALTHQNVAPEKVLRELDRRFGVSGIEEKRSR